jgi:hypothetical protein
MNEPIKAATGDPSLDAAEPEDDLGDGAKSAGGDFTVPDVDL